MDSMDTAKVGLAYFITPHGFGHAARASAVMSALEQAEPGLRFEIFTLTPEWFFAQSLQRPFGYHAVLTDIGLVQTTALSEDAVATAERLNGFLPFDPVVVEQLARQVLALGCRIVLCDISALGIAVAAAASVSSVLIENFTWDWIYEAYIQEDARMAGYAHLFAGLFRAADHHIQTEPVCQPGSCDLVTVPVSREPRLPPAEVRRRLAVPADAPMVLMSMGGVRWDYTFVPRLAAYAPVQFVIPGAVDVAKRHENTLLLPANSGWYHPDLVHASDAVIGKLGYSTLAETFHAGTRFGYVPRPRFRESEVFERYVEERMPGLCLSGARFTSGEWLSQLPELLALPRRASAAANGAGAVADYVLGLLATRGR